MYDIQLIAPEISKHSVTFRWRVDPESSLYRRLQFTLSFPENCDLSFVPSSLWWTLAIMCLHPHWMLLRPCRVTIPVQLRPGEADVWLRLLDSKVATFEAYRGTAEYQRQIELCECGPPLPACLPLPDAGRCATSFSGGKDSLLQAGLLSEFFRQPMLVATTSPLPSSFAHQTKRRHEVFHQITKRRDVGLIEVSSDYRSSYDNRFARALNYPVPVNGLSDTYLYTAALVAASAARGVTHLFLASEAEVQENVRVEGRVVEHPHCMYSTVSNRVLHALLEPYGIHFSSLTPALHSYQVQRLLWTRYRALRDLQYSCWRVGPDDATCSNCSQCLRLAFTALADRSDPGIMGIDLFKLLPSFQDWQPCPPGTEAEAALPNLQVKQNLCDHTVRLIQATPRWHLLKCIVGAGRKAPLSKDVRKAVRAALKLKEQMGRRTVPPLPGYRPLYLRHVDPLLRNQLEHIYAQYFQPASPGSYAELLQRSDELTDWILEPLQQPTGQIFRQNLRSLPVAA